MGAAMTFPDILCGDGALCVRDFGSSCSRVGRKDNVCMVTTLADKYMFAGDAVVVPGRCCAMASLRWNVACAKAAPFYGFAQSSVEPSVRRLVSPFCMMLDKKGALLADVSRQPLCQPKEDYGVQYLLDDYDAIATIEFAALDELPPEVEHVMFGMKYRNLNGACGNLAMSFAVNFTLSSVEEWNMYQPSFLGSEVLVLATLSRARGRKASTINGAFQNKEPNWILNNVSQTISRGVVADYWLPIVRERQRRENKLAGCLVSTDKNEFKKDVNAILVDTHVYQFIIQAEAPDNAEQERKRLDEEAAKRSSELSSSTKATSSPRSSAVRSRKSSELSSAFGRILGDAPGIEDWNDDSLLRNPPLPLNHELKQGRPKVCLRYS